LDGTPEAGEGEAAADGRPVRRNKRPESVLVVVMTRGGEALMLRRTRPSDFWQSVTGSLRWNESPLDAARRELTEETGLHPCDGRLIDLHRGERFPILPAWRARYARGVHYNREHWFVLVLPGRRLIRLNSAEHLEHRWLAAPRAAARATSWTNRNAILLMAGALGSAG
jgi:dihydroneopterin triphosphate diphosphatase